MSSMWTSYFVRLLVPHSSGSSLPPTQTQTNTQKRCSLFSPQYVVVIVVMPFDISLLPRSHLTRGTCFKKLFDLLQKQKQEKENENENEKQRRENALLLPPSIGLVPWGYKKNKTQMKSTLYCKEKTCLLS